MTRRQKVVTLLAAVLAGTLLGVAGWLVVGYIDHRRDTDHRLEALAQLAVQIAEDNRRNGALLVDCTTPTPQPTPEHPSPKPNECYERGQRGQSGAIVELDCRARRMQARLPAPPERRPCVDQTPAEVYPGVAGLPPR